MTTQMVGFSTWIFYCDSRSPALFDLSLFSNTSVSSAIDFPQFGEF